MVRMERGMRRGGDAGEAFEQGGRGGVEVLVGDAVDAGVADGAEVVPVALGDDAGERDAVAGSAPGEEENVWIGGGYFFGRGVRAGHAEEGGAGGFDQFGDPVLGMDERFSPLFAVDDGFGFRCEMLGAGASRGDGFGGGVGAGGTEEARTGGFDQLGDPGLGVDEGLAPLFAVD